MRKFKLVKNYPTAPCEIGGIAEEQPIKSDDHFCIRKGVGEYSVYPKYLITDFPEFWEEVKEKEYTILSFVNENGDFFDLQSCGKYLWREHKEQKRLLSLEFCLESQYLKIHSVKRESDGEIFTLGDLDGPSMEPITSITVNEDYGGIALHGRKFTQGLSHAKKAPIRKPILITEDGVEIFEGDCYHAVQKESFTSLRCNYKLDEPNKWITFSTLEKSEEYIKWNKPMYSLRDVDEAAGLIELKCLQD